MHKERVIYANDEDYIDICTKQQPYGAGFSEAMTRRGTRVEIWRSDSDDNKFIEYKIYDDEGILASSISEE